MLAALAAVVLAVAPAEGPIAFGVAGPDAAALQKTVGAALGKLGPARDLTAAATAIREHGQEVFGQLPAQPPESLPAPVRKAWTDAAASCRSRDHGPARKGKDPIGWLCADELRSTVLEELLRHEGARRYVEVSVEKAEAGKLSVAGRAWAPGGADRATAGEVVAPTEAPAAAARVATLLASGGAPDFRLVPRAPGEVGAPPKGPVVGRPATLPDGCGAELPVTLTLTPQSPMAEALARAWQETITGYRHLGPALACSVSHAVVQGGLVELHSTIVVLDCGPESISATAAGFRPSAGELEAIQKVLQKFVAQRCQK